MRWIFLRDMHRWGSGGNPPAALGWTWPVLDPNSLSYRLHLLSQRSIAQRTASAAETYASPVVPSPYINSPSVLVASQSCHNRFSFPSYQNFNPLSSNFFTQNIGPSSPFPFISALQVLNRQCTANYYTSQVVKEDICQQYFAQERNVSSQAQPNLKETAELPHLQLNMADIFQQLDSANQEAETSKGLGSKRQRHESSALSDARATKQLKQETNETMQINDDLIRQGQQILEQVYSLRQWEYTDFGYEHYEKQHPGVEFSVMSYNVLAQCLLEDNYYLYKHCKADVLTWEYRQWNLLQEIKALDSDVLCLQEIQDIHFNDFFKIELGKLGYDGVFKKRTGKKHDGCATFYRTEKFTLETSRTVEYFKPGIEVLDRDNIGLILLLAPRDPMYSDNKICVANTHILFNPRRGDIKLAQVSLLLAEINRIAGNSNLTKRHPIIVCGDFNCEPFCELYNFLGSGKLKYQGLVAGKISGQKDGMRGSSNILSNPLIPSSVGISEQCKFLEDCSSQLSHATSSIDVNASKRDLDNQSHSSFEIVDLLEDTEDSDVAPSKSYSTGKLKHNLKLVSVYKHFLQRAPEEKEITTHHSKDDCTVDYIFYSVIKKKSKIKDQKLKISHIKEGQLHLLAQYGLLSSSELDNLGGLPNAGLSSDHLSLMAKFLLS